MRPYRILVTGSRDWTDESTIATELTALIRRVNTTNPGRSVVIIDGACPKGGADKIANDYAVREGWTWERHPAEDHGGWPYCGPLRNQHMVDLGADICLAFPLASSTGTWDCAKRANKAGIRVVVVPSRSS